MLSGGHPNSLGRTVEVVDMVLADPPRFDDLIACYRSADPVVRLRVSNAMKRVDDVRRDLLLPYLERFLTEIAAIDQPSTQWTLAQLWDRLSDHLTADQRARATADMQRNLAHHDDWIVLNATMVTLSNWAKTDPDLAAWLGPHLARLTNDPRKSVSGRARKLLAAIAG